MTSGRLAAVYRSREWKELRIRMIDHVGGQCQWHDQTFTSWVRCQEMDKRYGGKESLTVDHTELYADPYDPRFLKVYCRRHHGIKDGGKRVKHLL